MSLTYKVLRTDIEFFAAAISQARVYVVSPVLVDRLVEVVDYGGRVEKFTPYTIKINGKYFMRKQFEFRTDVKGSTSV